MSPSEKLAAFREEIARQGLRGFIVPRADEHLGEYVPPSAERLAWLTKFTGSAGLAAVLPDRAAVFTDGRYTLQLAAQVDPALWEARHLTDDPPHAWLAAHAPAGAAIGYDPRLISEEGLNRYLEAGLVMRPTDRNPVDAVWRDRPPPPHAAAHPHKLEWAGRGAVDKRADIAAELGRTQQDAA
ncbi:MAG: aminopeptidase P family N-terminal domain-containing protein, partial [Acetobacteraceae bacterium]